MLEPLTLELSPMHMQALAGCSGLLSELGFAIEPFGGNSCLVRSVPSVLSGASLSEAIVEILDDAGSEKDPGLRDLKAVRLIACHGAIKAGQKLDTGEQAELIKQLSSTSRPRTCPHGRPTMLHLSSQQLKREFGRTQ
jgi:DNA mismatch repair protein MutL